MSDWALMGAVLLAVGAVVGLLAGLLGVGGGVVLVPAFAAVLAATGHDGPDMMRICLATSLSTIFVTSIRSTLAHHRKGAVDWAVLRGWGPWIGLGAVLGALLVAQLETRHLRIIFAALVPGFAAYMAFGNPDWRLGARLPRGALRVALAFPIGLIGVLLGIGGGVLGVGSMTLYGQPLRRAVATASGFGAVIAAPSVLMFLSLPADSAPPGTIGSVNLPIFAITVAMTMTTAPLGAALAHRVNAGLLRRIFAGFLVLVALNMLRGALV